MARGHAAMFAEYKKKEDGMTLKFGNLLPGQTATLKSTILSQLDVVAGHYCYSLPAAFFPDYKKLGIKSKDAFNYGFSYEVQISGDSHISNICIPANAEITSKNDASTEVLIRSSKPGSSVDLYYRTSDMMIP